MCWRCDHPDASFEDYLDEVVRPTVDRCGYAVQATERHGVPLAYTVGLAQTGRPELVVTGKPPDVAHDLLQALLAGEEVPTAGRRCDLVLGPAVWMLAVLNPAALEVAWAIHPGLSALQAVWADTLGRWPWQAHRSPQRLLCDLGDARAA